MCLVLEKSFNMCPGSTGSWEGEPAAVPGFRPASRPPPSRGLVLSPKASSSASAALTSSAVRAGVARPASDVPTGMKSSFSGLELATKSGVAATFGPAPTAANRSRVGLEPSAQPPALAITSTVTPAATARLASKALVVKRIFNFNKGDIALAYPMPNAKMSEMRLMSNGRDVGRTPYEQNAEEAKAQPQLLDFEELSLNIALFIEGPARRRRPISSLSRTGHNRASRAMPKRP